jgi:replicative DNA helicase
VDETDLLMSDLERKLLARCLSPVDIKVAYDLGVRAEMFEEPLCASVWNFTIDYWRRSQMQSAPTLWVLTQEWSGYTVEETVEEETEYLADRLVLRYASNELQEMVRAAAQGSVVNPRQALKELHAAAYRATEVMAPRITRTHMGDNWEQEWEEYLHQKQYPQGMGVPYGLDLLDLSTGGILPGELAVCAAFAKTGKTMMLAHAAVQAVHRGHRPVIFSLELSLRDMKQRVRAFFSGVSYNRLTKGHLTPDEELMHRQAMEGAAAGVWPYIERPEAGERTVAYLCSRARELGADYLIIDQLSKMEAGHKTFSTKEKYASILAQLKNDIGHAGRELPCLMAVQLRREEDEPNERSFADAAEIERDVDLAFALHRNRDLRRNHMMTLDILVSRRTDLARLILNWQLSEATRISTIREEPLG